MEPTETERDYTSIFYKSTEPTETEGTIANLPVNESIINNSEEGSDRGYTECPKSYDKYQFITEGRYTEFPQSYDTYRFLTEAKGTETRAASELNQLDNDDYRGVLSKLLEDYNNLLNQNRVLLSKNRNFKHIIRKQEEYIRKLEKINI